VKITANFPLIVFGTRRALGAVAVLLRGRGGQTRKEREHMKCLMAKFGRTVMVAALTVGTAGVASALPLNDSLVDMDFTSTGQITLSLYGPLADGWTNGTLQSGRVVGGSNAFDPLAFFGGQGTITNFAAFGAETADTSDDFVRFWITQGAAPKTSVWVMSTPSVLQDEPIDGPGGSGPNDIVVATAPEPGSMMLLGSGLLGLAAAARRRLRRTREE
jgi:hypothetical protein